MNCMIQCETASFVLVCFSCSASYCPTACRSSLLPPYRPIHKDCIDNELLLFPATSYFRQPRRLNRSRNKTDTVPWPFISLHANSEKIIPALPHFPVYSTQVPHPLSAYPALRDRPSHTPSPSLRQSRSLRQDTSVPHSSLYPPTERPARNRRHTAKRAFPAS